VAKSVGAPLREVTYELESDLQKRVGVTGVPLTLVIDRSGEVVAQLAGRLRMASLVRAVARAGF
jgi:thiol:disulfide interchange protein